MRLVASDDNSGGSVVAGWPGGLIQEVMLAHVVHHADTGKETDEADHEGQNAAVSNDCRGVGSGHRYSDLHLPQPPSPHDSFVPLRP